MPDDLLPPDPNAARRQLQADREDRPRSIVCSYCECTVARDGGVIRTSDRAKALNRQEDRIDALLTENTRLTTELTAAAAKIAEYDRAQREQSESGAGLSQRQGWAR